MTATVNRSTVDAMIAQTIGTIIVLTLPLFFCYAMFREMWGGDRWYHQAVAISMVVAGVVAFWKVYNW